MNSFLTIKALTKSFNNGKNIVVNDIDLSVKKGRIVAIIGESGSGKTTLTRLISGLETPDTGSIELNWKLVSDDHTFIPTEKRNIGMVFQDYALFPHLTVAQNIKYGIKEKSIQTQKTTEILELVGLSGFENRFPHQLSGGQQQRIALARALVTQPELLILDEPFSNLDVVLRLQLRNEIFNILKTTEVTTLFVTHDTQDAIAIADEIVVLKNGKLIQKGSAANLYENPKTLYVASLFSPITLLTEEDLSLFKFHPSEGKVYAIRINTFVINSNATYTTSVTILRSIFLGSHYMNTAILANNKTFNFISAEQFEDTIDIGFMEESLLEFDD